MSEICPPEVALTFLGVSDQLSPPVRMAGPLSILTKAGPGSESLEMTFLDGFFLCGGYVSWTGGSPGSYIQFKLVAPCSTVKTPVVPNTGNCNLVQIPGLGEESCLIVPADNDGGGTLVVDWDLLIGRRRTV